MADVTEEAKRLAIGGNKGPLITPAQLDQDNAAVLAAINALLEAEKAQPLAIGSDEEDAVVTDVVRDIAREIKRVEDTRKATKDPFLTAERTIDGYYNRLKDTLTGARARLEGKLTVWKRKKAEDERKRREEEARVAREAAAEAAAEAARVAAEAERERQEQEMARAFDDGPTPVVPSPPVQMTEVVQAQQNALNLGLVARHAERQASVATTEVTRTRGASGTGGSTLETEWKYEITDANAIPLDHLRVHFSAAEIDKAVARYVKQHQGSKPLAGVRIYPFEKARVY